MKYSEQVGFWVLTTVQSVILYVVTHHHNRLDLYNNIFMFHFRY